MSHDHRKTLGSRGEEAVLKYYRRQRYKILDQNWRVRRGEVDLIAAKKDVLVFVEVKTRSTDGFARPAENIDHKKQEKIVSLVELYLASHKLPKKIKKVRVDAAEAVSMGEEFQINVIENIIEL
jgi:putative endonuclease